MTLALTRRKRRPRGFFLYELLIALVLVGLAMNVGVRLFGMIARSYREIPAAARELQLQAQWLGVLRDDAWRARSIDLGAGDSLTLRTDDGSVVWRQDDGSLLREADGETRSWPRPRPVRWSNQDGILTLSAGDDHVPLPTPAREAVTP